MDAKSQQLFNQHAAQKRFFLIHIGPTWLKNLYFAYLLTLRAIVKAEPYWRTYQFYTGSEDEDMETRKEVARLILAAKYDFNSLGGLVGLQLIEEYVLNIIALCVYRSCSSLFDESMMFTGNSSLSLKVH